MIPLYSCGISIDLRAINIFAAFLKFISNIILTDSGNELSTGKPVNFFFKTEAGEKKYRLQRPGPVTDRPQTLVKSLIPQNPRFCDF